MNEEDRKAHIQKTFNTVASGYDNDELRFFVLAAQCLPELFRLHGDEHVLDVASGTGTPALTISPNVPNGKVTGVDFSLSMLEMAQKKAIQKNQTNVDFQIMDMTNLTFTDNTFDAANCSFGLFFIQDIVGLLKHIAQKVKPGGPIVTTHFADDAFSPLQEKFLTKIESYGIETPPIGWKCLASEEQNRNLYQSAGLRDIEIHKRDISYHLADATQWWGIIWNAGYRGLLSSMEPSQLEQFKTEHLHEIDALKNKNGIKINIQVYINRGIK
jgi:ubiquinone/menaquinone biosynthesis C-methylase UbiE